MTPAVDRDERTLAVENASFRLGYLVLSFGLLADVAYRGTVRQESNWDLLSLVILAGAAATGYQMALRIATPRTIRTLAAVLVLAAVVAAAIVLAT